MAITNTKTINWSSASGGSGLSVLDSGTFVQDNYPSGLWLGYNMTEKAAWTSSDDVKSVSFTIISGDRTLAIYMIPNSNGTYSFRIAIEVTSDGTACRQTNDFTVTIGGNTMVFPDQVGGYSDFAADEYATYFPAGRRYACVQGTLSSLTLNSSGKIPISWSASLVYGATTLSGSTTMEPWEDPVEKPTLGALSISDIGTTTMTGTYTVTDNGGETPTNKIEISVNDDMSSATEYSGLTKDFTGLTPYRRHYVRGNSTNSAGTTYTNIAYATTFFTNPGAPSNIQISVDGGGDPVPTATYNITWTAGSAGSTAVAGYRMRIYVNNSFDGYIDTDSTSTSYSFTGASKSLEVGDVIKVGLYSYSYDWNGDKHFNGDGATEEQVVSGTVTVISEKYISVSQNGGSFSKHRMYVSVNGGTFTEVLKDKFKLI